MKKIIFLIGSILLLNACSSNEPTDPNWRPDISQANLGKYPTQYPDIIKTWGNKNFDQATTAHYLTISTPRAEYLVTNSEKQEAVFGYAVCANISGLKSSGSYKPFQKHWFFIRNNEVIEHRDLTYGYNWIIYKDHKISCEDGE